MGKQIINMVSIPEWDLTNPTSTRKYPLGMEIQVWDDTTNVVSKYIYIRAGAALTAAQAYKISAASGYEAGTATPAASTSPIKSGIANVAFTSGHYGFLQTVGNATVTSAGTVTSGNAGRLTASATTITDEASSTESVETRCIFLAARTGAGAVSAFLLDKQSYILGAGSSISSNWAIYDNAGVLEFRYLGVAKDSIDPIT